MTPAPAPPSAPAISVTKPGRALGPLIPAVSAGAVPAGRAGILPLTQQVGRVRAPGPLPRGRSGLIPGSPRERGMDPETGERRAETRLIQQIHQHGNCRVHRTSQPCHSPGAREGSQPRGQEGAGRGHGPGTQPGRAPGKPPLQGKESSYLSVVLGKSGTRRMGWGVGAPRCRHRVGSRYQPHLCPHVPTPYAGCVPSRDRSHSGASGKAESPL